MLKWMVVGCLLLFAAPSWAQTTPSEEDLKKVEKLSAQAAVEFDKGNFQRALELYQQAHNLWKYPKLTFAMVRCLESMKKYKEALATAQRGLQEKPGEVLRKRFEGKVSFLKAQLAKGTLSLLVTPSGATIQIDGKVVGKAPLGVVSLSAGKHELSIQHPNHSKIEQGIVIKGGEKLSLSLKLQPLTGSLSVSSSPSGATVELDGRVIGKTPLKNIRAPLGSHQIQVSAKGYDTTTRRVELSAVQAENITVALSKQGAGSPSVVVGPWYQNIPAWILIAAGAGGVVGGRILLSQSSQTQTEIQTIVKTPNSTELSQQELDTRWNTSRNQELIGVITNVAGFAAFGVGVVLLVTQIGAPRRKVVALPNSNNKGQQERFAKSVVLWQAGLLE